MVLSNHDLALVDNKFSKPDLLDIVNHLKPKLGDKWQDIASVLKIPYSQIREIEKNPTLYGSHSAYLREVLHCWEIGEIDGKPYKWSTILRTLEHPSVGCSGVALEIFRNLMVCGQVNNATRQAYYINQSIIIIIKLIIIM